MDPLAGLMAMLASRRFLVAFVPALGMLLLAQRRVLAAQVEGH